MIAHERTGGAIVVHCDGCAGGFNETGDTEFRDAIRTAKADGWQVRDMGRGKGVCHYCPDCVADEAWKGKS